MKTSSIASFAPLSLIISIALSGTGEAVWTTNFQSVTSGVNGSAAGVWREVTNTQTGAGNDSAFVVSLTTNGDVKAVDGSDVTSRIDESFPWRDLSAGEVFDFEGTTVGPLPFAVPLPFAAGINGDFINIETDALGVSVVTIGFGSIITDPMLSFTDIEVDSSLTFTNAFTVVSLTPNLSNTGLVVGNNGIGAPAPFDDEAAGSLQFTGDFTELVFTVTNASMTMEDRTGYVVTSLLAPVAIPEPSSLTLLLGLGWLTLLRRRR